MAGAAPRPERRIRNAIKSGAVRPDVTVADIFKLVKGIGLATEQLPTAPSKPNAFSPSSSPACVSRPAGVACQSMREAR
jgi:hypothetical protein